MTAAKHLHPTLRTASRRIGPAGTRPAPAPEPAASDRPPRPRRHRHHALPRQT